MAFSSGTLLVGGGDVLLQLIGIIKTFVEADGWTTNLFADDSDDYGGGPYTGKRLHIQKTIDGTARFMNLRSFKAQEVFSDTGVVEETGIAAIASTGYNVANDWDKQPGYTSEPINGGTVSLGCGAIDLPDDVLSYHLFSQNSGNNIYIVCQNSTGYTGILFGVTSTGNYFLSGSVLDGSSSLATNALLTRAIGSGSLTLRKSDDSAWVDWPGPQVGKSSLPRTISTNSPSTAELEYSIVSRLLEISPDNFKGNNPLIPSYMGIVATANDPDFVFAGTVEGIKYVNMLFVSSLTELIFGGDTYVLFRLYVADDSNDATVGLAILK